MYTQLDTVTLRSGEVVELGIVQGPDADWRDRIAHFLRHKGEPWDWQNTELLAEDVGVEARFHLLHRAGEPFSQIMTVEKNGIGVLGHVFTNPEERGQGAASHIMKALMAAFMERGGKALYLGTGYMSQAYQIYRRHGFASVEPQSGLMAFHSDSPESFEDEYFCAGTAVITPADWAHWCTSPVLFASGLPGVVRCAPLELFGRCLTEGALLYPIRDNRQRQQDGSKPASGTVVLANPETDAVLGLAAWNRDPQWPTTLRCDVYCHPQHWERGLEMLEASGLPEDERVVAYADAGNEAKQEVLLTAGFRRIARLPEWIAADRAATHYVDVDMFERKPA